MKEVLVIMLLIAAMAVGGTWGIDQIQAWLDTSECIDAPDNYRRAAFRAEEAARAEHAQGDARTAIFFESQARHNRSIADSIDDHRTRFGCD